MPTLRENSWPSYMVVKNSTCTYMEGHSSWRHDPWDDQPKKSHSGPCMPPEDVPPSAAVWPGHHVLARQRNASGRCPQLPPIQNKHWDQVESLSWCHIDVCLHPEMSDQDQCRDTMGPHPLNSAQTHPEQLAWQTRSCPQSGKILLELPWWTLHRWWHPDQGWMSGHSTILQRQYYGRPPWKPCQYQQSNGPGQNMCLLAQHGGRHEWLHQAVSDMHWEQQSTSRDAETPWSPSQTLDKNRCWLLSRPFGKKAPHSSRLLQQVPICVSSGICTSFQDLYSLEGTLCSWRLQTPIQWQWV